MPICQYFFGFGERTKSLGDEGADGAMPPENFWVIAAPETKTTSKNVCCSE